MEKIKEAKPGTQNRRFFQSLPDNSVPKFLNLKLNMENMVLKHEET